MAVDTSEYLYGLPPEVQSQLARLARLCAGMSELEKLHARLAISTLSAGLALKVEDDAVKGVELISGAGMLLHLVDLCAQPEAVSRG